MSYGQQRYTKKEYVIDPHLYEDFDLSHNDVPNELKFLVPLMERLEHGELVDVHGLPNGSLGYLMEFYISKASKKNPMLKLNFMYEFRCVDGEPHEFGYLYLPTVLAPELIKKHEIKKETMRRKDKILNWAKRYWFLRTFIRLFI